MIGHVSPVSRLLGFAGLLPALFATSQLALGRAEAVYLALVYAWLILSFLGGIWWGFAMRRDAGQGGLTIIAVVPSLLALSFAIASVATVILPWVCVVTGVTILLTLLIDRRLVTTGDAPQGWMGLRVPLSVGLGGLTILDGWLLAQTAFRPSY